MENSLKWIVYCTTDSTNNYIYIGVHKTIPNKFDGYIGNDVYINNPSTYMHSKTKFQYAVKTHGVKCFHRTTIAIFDNSEDAYSLEAEIVNKEFLKRTDVYNMALGGISGGLYIVSIKTYLFDCNGNFVNEYDSIKDASRMINRSFTSVWRAIKEKCKCAGYFWTKQKFDKLDLTKMKLYEGLTTVPVFQYSKTGEYECCYESIKDAGRVLQKSDANISNAIKLGSLCYNKYFSNVFNPTFIGANNERIQTTKIYLYDLEGNFIAEYSGMPEAKKKLGIKSDIYKAIRLGRLAGGFQWSFEKLDKLAPLKNTKGRIRKIGKYDVSDNLIKEYESKAACEKENGKGILHVLSGRDKLHKGYKYKYLN